MENAPSSDDDSSSTSSQYSRGAVGGYPPIPKGTPGKNTTLGELSQPAGDRRRVRLQKQKKRTAAAVQDSSLGEDLPQKKAQNKKKEGSHYATGATFRTDSSSNSGNNNNSHGVAGAVSNSSNKTRASKPKNSTAQPHPAVHVPPRGIGPVYDPNPNDVLSGRVERMLGNTGNVQFREIMARLKEGCRSKKAKNLDSARIAAQIVYRIRSLTPPGRFLKKDADGLWFDIGDVEAIKKVGQALRAGAVPWEERYQELVGFHAIHGHFKLPQTDEWKTLYSWALCQKHRRAGSCRNNRHPLTQDQIRKLDAIGFDWTIKKRGKTGEDGTDGSSGGDRSAVNNTETVHHH